MEFKGTKNLYVAEDNSNDQLGNRINIRTEHGFGNHIVACCLDYNRSKNEANAKLFAVAPELLSALQDAVTGLEWEIEDSPEKDHKADEEKLEEWKSLINKALGQ